MTTTPSMIFPYRILPVLLIIGAMIAGCSSPPKYSNAGSPPYTGGGYYKDDGPGRNIPADVANIPDAVPRIEPHNRANFRPYTVMGQRFVPVGADTPLRQRGVASWYGRKFHGKKTANGETYDMYAMTAAHPTLPLPSYARVTHEQSGRSVIARVNDRGPFLRGRVIDLSYAAAKKLGYQARGTARVEVAAITIRPDGTMFLAGQPFLPGEAVGQPESSVVASGQMAGDNRALFVQLGSFSNRDPAEKLLSRARAVLTDPMRVRAIDTDSGRYHRVQVGPFDSEDSARRTQGILKAEGFSQTILLTDIN